MIHLKDTGFQCQNKSIGINQQNCNNNCILSIQHLDKNDFGGIEKEKKWLDHSNNTLTDNKTDNYGEFFIEQCMGCVMAISVENKIDRLSSNSSQGSFVHFELMQLRKAFFFVQPAMDK